MDSDVTKRATSWSLHSQRSPIPSSTVSPSGARTQGGSSGIVYGGLKYQARCIADVRAGAGSTTFLAGTLSLKEENEVHLIRLSPAESELVCDGLFYHPNKIWDLKSWPFDHRVFSTVYTSGESYGASVWKITDPELYGQLNSPQLEQLFALDEYTAKIRWTWAVRLNPEYDELILSAGTDSTINLWLAKVGTDDSGPESPFGSPQRQEESLLNSYTDYEDSIYGIAWSSHDPPLLNFGHFCLPFIPNSKSSLPYP